MAIEEWESEQAVEDLVDDPRRHTLGGFRPGEGFHPLDDDETLTSLEFDIDEVSGGKNADSGKLDPLVAELWKP